VLLGDEFVKVPQREVGIHIAFEPTQQLNASPSNVLVAFSSSMAKQNWDPATLGLN
jgi:hypothetical protein